MSFIFTKTDRFEELHPNIRNFLPTFIKHRVDEYELFKHAVAQGEIDAIRLYCHKIVGISASYNCFKLEEMAFFIQKCSRENNVEAIKEHLDIFSDYINELAAYSKP